MSIRLASVLMMLTAVSAASLRAQILTPVFVEYVAGRGALKAQRGSLATDATAVLFTNDGVQYVRHVKTIFEIPLATIVSAVASTEATHGVSGFSWNAVKSQDYLTITTETDQGAEALVFKVDNKQAAGLAAKIEFAAKKAKQAASPPKD